MKISEQSILKAAKTVHGQKRLPCEFYYKCALKQNLKMVLRRFHDKQSASDNPKNSTQIAETQPEEPSTSKSQPINNQDQKAPEKSFINSKTQFYSFKKKLLNQYMSTIK